MATNHYVEPGILGTPLSLGQHLSSKSAIVSSTSHPNVLFQLQFSQLSQKMCKLRPQKNLTWPANARTNSKKKQLWNQAETSFSE
jgi:hypothetical protein